MNVVSEEKVILSMVAKCTHILRIEKRVEGWVFFWRKRFEFLYD